MKRLTKRLLAVIFLLSLPPAAARAQVTFKPGKDKVDVEINGQPFTTFYYGGKWAKPFLHPLRASTGVKLTRGFPVEEVAGESHDHYFHHGLWYAHSDINGIDFWREMGDTTTKETNFPLPLGRMVMRSVPTLKGGKDEGTLTADLDLVAPDNRALGVLREKFTFRRAGANNIIDAQITLNANRGEPLKLADTEEGGLSLRLADEFRQDRGATLLNSDGLVGTEKIWGKRAKWVDYSTTLNGEKVGVTMFDHPRNPRHPTWWHARPYGLNVANPYGERSFTGDKTRDGVLTIPTGGRLSFQYRVLIHPGPADAAAINQQWTEFANGK